MDTECEAAVVTQDFPERWRACQGGPPGGRFMDLGKDRLSIGKQAEFAKDLYSTFTLTDWRITGVRHTNAAVALVDAVLTVNEIEQPAELRWVRLDAEGHSAAEWETGIGHSHPTARPCFSRSQHELAGLSGWDGRARSR